MTFVDFFSFFCLLMITAVQSKALSDEDIRTNQQFAKVFKDTIKVCWFDCLELFLRAYEFFSSKAYIIDFFFQRDKTYFRICASKFFFLCLTQAT